MSQLLQHPFCGHWQTHSCPDGVLIHNAAAKIIPQPGFLFTHLAGSFSFSYQTINWPSLSRTLPLYCSFYSASKGQLSHLNSPQFLLLLITCQLCSLLRLCHICEKDSLKHCFFVAFQPVPRNTFWPKKILPTDILELGSSGCLWCPFVKANFTRQDMCNIRNLEKHPMKSLPKVTRNRLRYADP